MHPHNRYDGQLEILSQYACGDAVDAAFPPPLPGHLQHDWDPLRVCPAALDLPAGMPSLVWSDAARRRLYARGHRRQVVVGAPWLYLLAREGIEVLAVPDWISPSDEPAPLTPPPRAPEPPVPVPAGTAWFPQHGLRGAHAARELAREVASEGEPTVTVVLTEPDLKVETIRLAYAERGLAVRALGPRGRPPGGTGPSRLEALRLVLSRHTRVASNGLHLAHLYGAAAGLCPSLAGPAVPGVPEVPAGPAADLLADHGRDASAVSAAELGAPLPSRDLRLLLDWTSRA